MIKVCHVCGKEKEHKSWKATTCNDCLADGLKWCSSCKQVKRVGDFHKNGHTLRSFCKKCECTRSLTSKEATGYYRRPDVRKRRNEDSRLCKRAKYLYDEEYRTAELVRCHNRRAAATGSLTTEEWLAACEAFDLRCAYCGSTCKLTMDHVVPVSNGGVTEADNIVPACQSCNSSKQNKDIIEWYTAQPFYSKSRLEIILKFTKKGGDAE